MPEAVQYVDPVHYAPGALWRRTTTVNFAVSRIRDIAGKQVLFEDVASGDAQALPRYHFEELHEHMPVDPSGLVISGVGHRPEHLVSGAVSFMDTRRRIYDACTRLLAGLRPRVVITNMGQGFGQWFGWAAVRAGIPLAAAIPFSQQAATWAPDAQAEYAALLERAAYRTVVADLPGMPPASSEDVAYDACNRWMVGNSAVLITAWRGRGGRTLRCIEAARQAARPRLFINNPDLLP